MPDSCVDLIQTQIYLIFITRSTPERMSYQCRSSLSESPCPGGYDDGVHSLSVLKQTYKYTEHRRTGVKFFCRVLNVTMKFDLISKIYIQKHYKITITRDLARTLNIPPKR
jgi:hypothetical protein